MALLDNLSTDDRNRLLLGLGARMWMGGLQGQNAGRALAGGILPALDEYGQITAEARRAKREQQMIDQANMELDRQTTERQAAAKLNASLQGGESRGLYAPSIPVRGPEGDLPYPGAAYHPDIPAATTPFEIGSAFQRYAGETGNANAMLQAQQIPGTLMKQADDRAAMEREALQRSEAELKTKAFKEAIRKGNKGLATSILEDMAKTPSEALAAFNYGHPVKTDFVMQNVNGMQIPMMRKTSPTGEISYEGIPGMERLSATDAALAATIGKNGGAQPAPAPPSGPGLGDRVLKMLTPDTQAERNRNQDRSVLPLPKFGNIGLGEGITPPSGMGQQQNLPSTDPKIQAGEAITAKVNAIIAAGGKPQMDELQAAISHAEYINDSRETRRLKAQYRFMYGSQ